MVCNEGLKFPISIKSILLHFSSLTPEGHPFERRANNLQQRWRLLAAA
jgi:hypothetical protein